MVHLASIKASAARSLSEHFIVDVLDIIQCVPKACRREMGVVRAARASTRS